MRSALVHGVMGSLLLLACWPGASPLVLCVGAEGHAALESPLTGCCGESGGCAPALVSPVAARPLDHAEAPSREGACLDAPLPLWQVRSTPQRAAVAPPPTPPFGAFLPAPPQGQAAGPRVAPATPPLARKTLLLI